MNIDSLFKKLENLGFAKKVKRKINYLFEFNNSQLNNWLEGDKKWLKHLIKAEKSVEKHSKFFLWKRFSKTLFWDYAITSYFVNFQYFVELLNTHGTEMWLSKKMNNHNNDWWDDLYISLRLSLMWHYKWSFFHLRSFMENYFMIVWEHAIKTWKIDIETKEFKKIKYAVKPKFRYLTSPNKNKNLKENNIDLSYLFDWNEYAKIYDYLSKFTHNEKQVKENYSDTIVFNEEIFDKYMRISSLVILLTIRCVYAFMEKEIEKQWLKSIKKPIPRERNFYRYIIWEMIYGDMFYDLYEDKINRDFLKDEVKIDAEKLYPKLKETIKDLEMYKKLRKQAWWDHDIFLDLVYKWKNNWKK